MKYIVAHPSNMLFILIAIVIEQERPETLHRHHDKV